MDGDVELSSRALYVSMRVVGDIKASVALMSPTTLILTCRQVLLLLRLQLKVPMVALSSGDGVGCETLLKC